MKKWMEINVFQLDKQIEKMIRGGQGGFHLQEDLLPNYFEG
jgi:hypothetical protein